MPNRLDAIRSGRLLRNVGVRIAFDNANSLSSLSTNAANEIATQIIKLQESGNTDALAPLQSLAANILLVAIITYPSADTAPLARQYYEPTVHFVGARPISEDHAAKEKLETIKSQKTWNDLLKNARVGAHVIDSVYAIDKTRYRVD